MWALTFSIAITPGYAGPHKSELLGIAGVLLDTISVAMKDVRVNYLVTYLPYIQSE